MTPTLYQIFRCPSQSTLTLYSELTITHPGTLCPTTLVTTRTSHSRKRTQIVIPILPSFLFLPTLTTSLDLPHPISSKIRPLRHPTLGPRFCTLSEIERISSPSPNSSNYGYNFQLGDKVQIVDNFLAGVTGTVIEIRNNGTISLKVLEDIGLQINTCIVSESVLQPLAAACCGFRL